jgi:predicted deacylase
MSTIQTYSYHASVAGPRLLVLGAVHGNETCGPVAMRQILPQFENGQMQPQKGSVTFIPICNPEAYKQNKRFIEHNLNRMMQWHDAPALYEEKLMNILIPYLEACDVILDIHSYTVGGPAFAFRGPDKNSVFEEAMVTATGLDSVIYGWQEAYAVSEKAKNNVQSVGTTEFARQRGAKGITIECGQHRDPTAVPVALRAIKGALDYCGIVPDATLKKPEKLQRTRMKKMFYKDREGVFNKNWTHLEAVQAGTVLATYDDGEKVTAPFDSRIILPNVSAPLGQEWIYLGVDE